MFTYQVAVHQSLAVTLDASIAQPLRVYPDRDTPLIAIRPAHEERAQRLSEGGTRIGIEFESKDDDLVRVMNEGTVLIEDFLAALSLASGIPFPPTAPLQILRMGSDPSFDFLRFLPFQGLSWQEPVAKATLGDASNLELHWRELDAGYRLKRAASRYRRALATGDPVEGFQHAYAGLESLEKPLADEIGIPAGSETVHGKCSSCGTSYEYRRTVLAGVRAFVKGVFHRDQSDDRAKEWQQLSKLRHDLVHGLKDLGELAAKSKELLATACHYLHDSSVHLAHLHELESNQFRLLRLSGWFVIRGEAVLDSAPSLPSLSLLLEGEPMRWVQHDEYGYVPEYELTSQANGSVEGQAFVLEDPFRDSSEQDLVPAPTVLGGR